MGHIIDPFGTTPSGEAIQAITLTDGDLTVRLLTWGAILQSMRLAGVAHDLTLTSDYLANYPSDLKHLGSVIGPVVNRLTNAAAVIAGVPHQYEVNFNDRHTIHSGSADTHRQNWAILAANDGGCTLGLTLPDGQGGFPGLRQISAEFTVMAPATLTMTLRASSDAETIPDFANHSYWNLDRTPAFTGHHLRIASEAYLPSDADFKPTKQVRAVVGTGMDFRQSRPVAPAAPDLDTCFVLGHARQSLRDVL